MRDLIFAFVIVLTFNINNSEIFAFDDLKKSQNINDLTNDDLKRKEKTSIELANPASVYCTKMGGSLEIKIDPETGGAYGLCHLSDGRVCEEWAFFRDQKCVNPENQDEQPS